MAAKRNPGNNGSSLCRSSSESRRRLPNGSTSPGGWQATDMSDAPPSGDPDAAARRRNPIQKADLLRDEILIDPANRAPLTGEMWTIMIHCKGAEGEPDREVWTNIDKADITFYALSCFKNELGYGMRDYLYYKKRCGHDTASLEAIDFMKDVEGILNTMGSERKLRFIMTRTQEKERHVNITPMKRLREIQSDDEDDDEDDDDDDNDDDDSLSMGESFDAYKDWLEEKGPLAELRDETRDDTIRAYTEWLREEGELNEILAYKNQNVRTTANDDSNDSSEAQEIQWPPHARKIKKKTKDGKDVGRGTMKVLAAMAKRAKSRTEKLKIEFSTNLGGPCGDNRRTFVDEITWFTRLYTPLIGVKYWKQVHQEVKNKIANSILSIWDLEDNANSRKIIWSIAQERYKGWRSTFSATYRAFKCYDARMKHKPVDLDIVEWHYLNQYFGSKKFKKVSSQNSSNRQQMKTIHVMGSKPFSQCSWEKRDLETGAEPGPLNLFKTTHTKKGKWSNAMSESIYINTARKLSMTESNEMGDEESRSTTSANGKEALVFQATYQETTGAKSTKLRGHGYCLNPNKNQMLRERLEEQEREVQNLKEELAKEKADKEGQKAQLKDSIREELMVELRAEKEQEKAELAAQLMQQFKEMFAHNNQTKAPVYETTPETNNTTEGEVRIPEINITLDDAARTNDDDIYATPMQRVETTNQIEIGSIITTKKRTEPSLCNHRPSKISKTLFTDNHGKGGVAAKYITSQQLVVGAKTRASKKKQLQDMQPTGGQ